MNTEMNNENNQFEEEATVACNDEQQEITAQTDCDTQSEQNVEEISYCDQDGDQTLNETSAEQAENADTQAEVAEQTENEEATDVAETGENTSDEAEFNGEQEEATPEEEILIDQEEKDNIQKFSEQCENIFTQIGRDVIGQKDIVEGTVIAMIAGGNVLLEGVPGVGKTRLVRSLGRVFSLPFSRIQFTPDLMPADVTGTNIIVKDEQGNTQFSFQPGPVFNNIILADEINRATPKTQSALLEAMQEHTVTVMGVSRKLDEPFFVLATQNPIEQDGTYPLPEAQMDRFMFKLIVKNPSLEELMDIVNLTQKTMAEVAEAACTGEELLEMRKTANQILVAEDVMRYAMTLCSATHPDSDCATETAKKYVRLGASPRAGQALISAAKVRALMHGRFNVSYDDLHELAYPVLRHRMKLNFEAIAERIDPDTIIKMIIKELNGKKFAPVDKKQDNEVKTELPEETTVPEDAKATKKAKKGLFGRK